MTILQSRVLVAIVIVAAHAMVARGDEWPAMSW